MTDRLSDLRNAMRQEGVDLVALAPGAHLRWLQGVTPHADERPLLLCVTAVDAAFLMPALEADSVRPHTDLPFHEWSDADGPATALDRLLGSINAQEVSSVVLDETMRADHAALIQDRLPGARRSFTETTVGRLRMLKDAGEFALLKENAGIADAALLAAWKAMKAGMTEAEVADVIEESFISAGAKPLFRIVGAGANGAFPHHQTGQTKLAPRQAVVMDIGAGKGGYSSDITRMALIGEAPEGYGDVHNVVETAVRAAMDAARPGASASAVDNAARGVIAEAGYGDHFLHRTGHGMGVEVHEPPWITSASETVLEEGMVFSIEPGIYLPGRFGIRLEEIVILRADSPEILSQLPRDAVTIG